MATKIKFFLVAHYISITIEQEYETLTSFQCTAFQEDHIKITFKKQFQCNIYGQGRLECCVKIMIVKESSIFTYKYGIYENTNFKIFIFLA